MTRYFEVTELSIVIADELCNENLNMQQKAITPPEDF